VKHKVTNLQVKYFIENYDLQPAPIKIFQTLPVEDGTDGFYGAVLGIITLQLI